MKRSNRENDQSNMDTDYIKALDDESRAKLKAFFSRVSHRNQGALVRHSFVRTDNAGTVPPLARLASSRGRGSAVPIKLYLGLLWLSSRPPYDSRIPARNWAYILNLEDPDKRGFKRILVAMEKLESENLLSIEHRPGDTNRVTIRKEDGSNDKYKLPKGKAGSFEDQYFKVPVSLWTEGDIQALSSSAITMLLIIMEEYQYAASRPQWWSTKIFKERFHISKDVRAKGTRELEERGLISVKRVSIPVGKSQLEKRRSRKIYAPIGHAVNRNSIKTHNRESKN